MWRLFSSYYADLQRAQFEADLAPKQDLIILRDSGDGQLRGFSTIEVYRRRVGQRAFIALFSGDTIIEEAYWGQSALQRTFVRYLFGLKLRNPATPVYWFLISKGYKTYLLLARNFPIYFPRHDRPTPPWAQQVLDHLALDKYGDAYQAEAGVLRFAQSHGRLKDGVAPLDTALLTLPDVRYFVDRNPGHAKGEELCCLGEMTLSLPLYFSARLLKKAGQGAVRRIWAFGTASS